MIFVAEFGGFWVEGAGCGGPEWVDNEGSEAGFEGYSMEEGERGLERRSQGTIKTGNDWKG